MLDLIRTSTNIGKEHKLPSISIIMNIWNGALYLSEAIDSVLAQTYSDWELIAFDDRSTDNSAEIVLSYKDPRIHYICAQSQVPLGCARDLALREAQGNWIAFLDQDDLWVPEKLERQLALGTIATNVGLVYGRTVSFTASGAMRDFDHRHEYRPLPEGAILEHLFKDACFISMSSAMFRRSALDGIGGIPPEIRMSPDYHMYLGVCQLYEARAVQEVICYYRLHSNNMTPKTFKAIHTECLWLIDRWGRHIAPNVIARRKRVHHSLVALKELQKRETRRRGLLRLVEQGSIPYLMSRPAIRIFRRLRRQFQQPRWNNAPGS